MGQSERPKGKKLSSRRTRNNRRSAKLLVLACLMGIYGVIVVMKHRGDTLGSLIGFCAFFALMVGLALFGYFSFRNS
jgi:hypothetical protein